jgi:hypothetical protein
MATWAEFAEGPAEVSPGPGPQGGVGAWERFEPGAAVLAEAGERLLSAAPAGINLLGTVSRTGRPRVHPFMPRVVDGRLWAFIGTRSPKARDLEQRPFTIHTPPAEEDEEFWVSGDALRFDDSTMIEQLAAAMSWAKPEHETLFEFDLDTAGWTIWLDFGTSSHRPQHHRWRART